MRRYDWESSGFSGRGGRAADRAEWSLGRALFPEVLTGLPDGDGGAPAPGFAPPTGRDALWQPLGPTTMLRGAVDSDVRVAGRVNDLAIHDDGLRAYAVSGLGGVWYTGDGGAVWEPVGAWRASDRARLRGSSHTLAGGAIHVHFGADVAADEVWVGTGEPMGAGSRDTGVRGSYGGVGILHKVGPVAAARLAPFDDPWDPAQAATPPPAGGLGSDLRGEGVVRFAHHPDPAPAAPHRLLAATTAGLHQHDLAAVAGTDPWSLVVVPAWEALAAGTSGRAFVTDVAWLPATGAHADRRLACAVGGPAGLAGLWASTGGGAFVQVALPGMAAATRRLALAADPAHPDVAYVLGTGPRLWRIDASGATPVAAAVGNLPSGLFGTSDLSFYVCSAAIDPGNSARVMVGGAAVLSRLGEVGGAGSGSWAAALFRLTVSPALPPGSFATDYSAGDALDPTWVGSEVHADVHAIRWLRPAAGGQVWIGCDGGVFASASDGARGTYHARTSGMAVAEPGFVANSPRSPGPLLAGLQDNGPQLRIGEGVWRQANPMGDGGGAAFDPGAPGRFVMQYVRASWTDDGGTAITPSLRKTSAPGTHHDLENRQSRFYSNPAVSLPPPAGPPPAPSRLAIGTDRVWFSTRWGASRWDGTVWRREWVTLPTATDPRAGDASTPAALSQDRLAAGLAPWGATTVVAGIRAMRWQTPTRLLALTRGTLHALVDPGAPGAWTPTQVATRMPVPVAGVPATAPAPAAAAGLPGFGEYNDLGVHDPAVGSLYLATSHPLDPVWWWDGVGQCHPTGLGTLPAGTRAPAYAIAVDPADPAIVYAGTTIGVWQGRFTPPAAAGGAPSWAWRHFANGLPEAAAQDLAIGEWPRGAGEPPLRLLRVALQARGVFEVDLEDAAADRTYLRVHPYDTRRILPTPLADPLASAAAPRRTWDLDWAYERNRDHRTGGGAPAPHPDGTPVTGLLWHASPDVVCRPAPLVPPPPVAAPPAPSALPWNGAPPDRFWLWSLQTAIHALAPATFPDAPFVVADGRWTGWWAQRLQRIRLGLGLAAVARVDAALWNDPRVQSGFWTPAWAAGGPAEADLVERVVGMATPRTGSVTGRATRAASAAALRRPYAVDVCVHQRGLAAPADQIAVTLLRTTLPASATAWAGVAPPSLAGLAAALDALPPDTQVGPPPNSLPGWVPPAPWTFVDGARPARRPRTATGPAQASVVTFDADFSAAPAGSDVLLLALVHHRTEPVTLGSAAGIRDAVLGSSHAAARSLRLV